MSDTSESESGKNSRCAKKTGVLWVGAALIVVFCLGSFENTTANGDFFARLLRFSKRAFPPDFHILPELVGPFFETARIAVSATFFAVTVSFVWAFLASRHYPLPMIRLPLRVLANAIRSVPSLAWAVVSVAVLGAGALAGAVALTIYSTGYLAKFFTDSLDSVNPDLKTALRDNGASVVQAFAHGIWPSVRSQLLSHALWMLEYNLRASTVIGYVGAGGIGLRLHVYQEFGQWQRFSAVLICIFVIVMILDFFGSWVRRQTAG
jgi:phosphonate transport system permease protein